MRKIEKRQIIKNVSSVGSLLESTVVLGLALSPFILHRLGDTAFGIWVLILSITATTSVRSRHRVFHNSYVSKFTATGEHEELAKLINTSLSPIAALAW